MAPGTYRFKFKIEYSDTIPEDESSKDTFRKKFFLLVEKSLKSPDNEALQKKSKDMVNEGVIKKFLTEKEVKDFLTEKEPKNDNVMIFADTLTVKNKPY